MNAPIFIIGSPRSGTTLLRLMLTCHKNIVIPPECGFAVWLYSRYKWWKPSNLGRFMHDLMCCRKIETWHLDGSGLFDFLAKRQPVSYSEVVSSVYEWYGLSQKRDFERWGDKNTFYVDHIPTIRVMFSNVNFVHIIRDGRDVACSYKELKKRRIDSQYAPVLPHQIEDIAKQWKTNLATITEAFDALGWKGVYEIRFEDLVLDAEKGLRVLCEQLGEEYDPRMLNYFVENREQELEPKEFLQWKEKTLFPLMPGVVGRYAGQLGKRETRIFERIAGKELLHYGYM